jgi:hypothetical protein
MTRDIETEGKLIHWPNEKDNQRSTNTIKTTNHRAKTPAEIGDEPSCCGGASILCPNSYTRRVISVIFGCCE